MLRSEHRSQDESRDLSSSFQNKTNRIFDFSRWSHLPVQTQNWEATNFLPQALSLIGFPTNILEGHTRAHNHCSRFYLLPLFLFFWVHVTFTFFFLGIVSIPYNSLIVISQFSDFFSQFTELNNHHQAMIQAENTFVSPSKIPWSVCVACLCSRPQP